MSKFKILTFLFAIIILGNGCAKQSKIADNFTMREKVTFKTEDGVEIYGDYLSAGAGSPDALLLHMMPARRVSWSSFMEKLREAGFSSLAIDFRGHGESTKALKQESKKAILDYKKFSDKEQQEKILDVRAAVEWLQKNKGASRGNLVVVGASIGANLALQYLTENSEIKKAVLLSPGLDYRGIKTDILIKKLSPNQRVLLAASDDDSYSFETNRTLKSLAPNQAEALEFSGLGHGTTMFERQPELIDEVINWLKK